jgi:bud site selection protein 20
MPAIRGQDSKKKTRRHTRDLDQIHADLHDEKHLAQFKDAKPIEDLPGLGQYYCKECAKFFESETNLNAHQKGKVHKRRYAAFCRMPEQSLTPRRVKQLREEPYSQKEAEAAMGLTTDNGKRTAAPMDIDETAA